MRSSQDIVIFMRSSSALCSYHKASSSLCSHHKSSPSLCRYHHRRDIHSLQYSIPTGSVTNVIFTSALTTKSHLCREKKSQGLSKVSSCVQSITSESLTVPTMQQSITKNYRIGHQSSKRKHM